MFTLHLGERGRVLAALGGLWALAGAAHAQTSLINPGIYDNGTATTEFAGRGSLEFNPPTRGNVWIIGNGSLIASESTRPTNPWASVLGQPQPFELNYNVDTGDISWSLLGTTLTGNQTLPTGTGLAYLMPLVVTQSPDPTVPPNTTKLSDVTVAVNGGSGTNFGNWSVTGTGNSSGVIYFTQYDVHTVKVTGNMMFDITAWPTDINGAYADVAFVSAAPVPEPTTIAVVGVGLAAIVRKRRRRA